jgi:hypothetical protein
MIHFIGDIVYDMCVPSPLYVPESGNLIGRPGADAPP